MKVTRALQADVPPALANVCKAMGFVRADIWRRYGALGTAGKNANAIRKQISAAALYDGLPVDGTIRAETTKDIVNDVLLYKAAAAVVVSEDLSSPIASKVQWKRYNRRMGAWAKGVFAESLDSVCTQRMDSTNGLLQGKRVGDKFYRLNGDVLQADHNGSRITDHAQNWPDQRDTKAALSSLDGDQRSVVAGCQPCMQFWRCHRPSVEITLAFVAPHFLQHGGLLLGFNALGNDGHVQNAAQVNDHSGNRSTHEV